MNAETVTDNTATDVCTDYYEGFDQKNTAKEQTMKYLRFPKYSDIFYVGCGRLADHPGGKDRGNK